tara:strand:- start:451 stop:1551 length:1101 start_codon:yes stop_codon:yes gene_type:complete
MNKKNIILFMPSILSGGVEKNFHIIANYFATKFNNLYICTAIQKDKNKYNKKIKFIKPRNKINYHLNIRLKYLVALYLLFKFLINNKNSIVFAFQANIYCILICKLFNVKVVIRSNTSPLGWKHNIIKKIAYNSIIKLADAVIVNSLHFKKQMDSMFNIKSICIYNPFNYKEIIKLSKKKFKTTFFKNKKYLKIINIGRFTKQKDQITIIKAIKNLDEKINCKLIIVGIGKEENNLKKYVYENKLKKSIKIINYLKNPYSLLKQSDLFVLSSKYEGLPNVLLEAVAMEKFIISTDCPTGPREILLNGRGGLFFKIGDHIDLAKKIIFYYNNKNKMKTKIKLAKRNLYKFNYEKNLSKYYKLINNIN